MPELKDDEKLMAALCYWGSTLLWCIPAVVIFMLKSGESPFIRKQALQAIALNLGSSAVYIVLFMLAGLIGMVTFGIGSMFIVMIEVVIYLGLLVYYVILGMWTFQGQDPTIPLLTALIEKNFLS